MAVIRKRGRKFVLDYRLNGARERVTVDTKEEAQELCAKYNSLRRAARLDEFRSMVEARQAIDDLEVRLTGKSLKDSVHEYAETCSKLKSPQTQTNERIDFTGLYNFLHKERDVYYLREVTPQHLEEYQGRLFTATSGSSCNRRFNTFKHFFNKCVEWGYLDKSPAHFIKRKREKATPRKTFTDSEVEQIVAKLPDHVARPFLFMAASGVRPGEAVGARVGDWNVQSKTLRVESAKNAGVMRTVYLNDTAIAVLSAAMEAKARPIKPGDHLFVNTRGGAMKPAVLTRGVKRVCKRLGIEDGKTPYGLRHTFATKHAMLNVSSEKTKRLMGHASIRTTEKYYKLGETELKDTVEQSAKVFDFTTKQEVKTVTDGHKVG